MTTKPADVEQYMRIFFANRQDIGMCAWRQRDDSDCSGRYFDFEETLAIAGLILQGWKPEHAAAVVSHRLVVAVPYVPGFYSEFPDGRDMAGSVIVAYIQLADETFWEIMGDSDLDSMSANLQEDAQFYRFSSTRNLKWSDDNIIDRLNQIMRIFPSDHFALPDYPYEDKSPDVILHMPNNGASSSMIPTVDSFLLLVRQTVVDKMK